MLPFGDTPLNFMAIFRFLILSVSIIAFLNDRINLKNTLLFNDEVYHDGENLSEQHDFISNAGLVIQSL